MPTASNPRSFISVWTYGSTQDPYGFGYDGEDNHGRVWWIQSPDDDGPDVTAWDFLEAHPEVSWEEIYAREAEWSRDVAL